MAPSHEVRLAHLRAMIRARVIDERLAMLYRQPGNIRGGSVFLGKGQEAFSAAGGMQLRQPGPGSPGDILAPLIRDSGARHAFGETMYDAMTTHLGRRSGPMRGRDGNIHRGRIETGILPMISHLGAGISVVCGFLMSRRLRGLADGPDRAIGLVSIGDGGMNTGALHEALNLAAVERLPLVVMVADNQVAYSTFSDRTYACASLVDRAAGYGMRGQAIDGTDADACLAAMAEACSRARAGEGPQMVVATLLRMAGHGEHDDASYVPQSLKDRFADCLVVQSQRLIGEGLIDAAGVEALWEAARAEAQDALDRARAEAEADPASEDWCALSIRDYSAYLP